MYIQWKRERHAHSCGGGKRLTQSLTINKLKRLAVAVCAHLADSTVILLMAYENRTHVSVSVPVYAYVDAILCARGGNAITNTRIT